MNKEQASTNKDSEIEVNSLLLEDRWEQEHNLEMLRFEAEAEDREQDQLLENVEEHRAENVGLVQQNRIRRDWANSTFIRVEDLLPNSLNVNEMDQETYKALKEQIAEGEILTELIVTPSMLPGKYEVLDGNHKLAIAKELGIQELPCRVVNAPPEEKLAYTLKLNTKGKVSIEKVCKLLEFCREKMSLRLEELAKLFKPVLGSYANRGDLSKILNGYSRIKEYLMKLNTVDQVKAKGILFSSFKTVEAAAYENPEDLVRKGEYRKISQSLKRKPRPGIWRVFTCPHCNTEWRISYNVKRKEYYAWKKGEGKEHYLRREKW